MPAVNSPGQTRNDPESRRSSLNSDLAQSKGNVWDGWHETWPGPQDTSSPNQLGKGKAEGSSTAEEGELELENKNTEGQVMGGTGNTFIIRVYVVSPEDTSYRKILVPIYCERQLWGRTLFPFFSFLLLLLFFFFNFK